MDGETHGLENLCIIKKQNSNIGSKKKKQERVVKSLFFTENWVYRRNLFVVRSSATFVTVEE